MNELQGVNLGGCELQEEIGQGGMGFVYRAQQLSLDRTVAVKILAEHLGHNPSFVERFQREARAIARVNHPNILGVYDVGHQEGRHYMIMELVEGGSLAELLEKRGLVEPVEATEMILQAARGLECAANQNIIHRDVKPDNIMLTSGHVVKVADFGLAKELDSTMTETQAVMGTPAYMSPEQCDGRDLDSRTDIYSLGGTFYRCLTGRLPFEADTAMSMMYRHKHVPLTAPHKIVPTLPEGISNIIVRMMAKDRKERFQSMGEVIRALSGTQDSKPAFDPGRTMPLDAAEEPARPSGVSGTVSEGPAFINTDSRIMAVQRTPAEIEDTRARCKKAARQLRDKGKLAQAARELRRLLDVAPDDDEAQTELRDIEQKVALKRSSNAEIRSLVASSHYEEAVEKWNQLTAELQDEQIGGQMERLESSVVPALRQVARADEEASAGNLEEAAALYAEAIKLDPNSEKAKQGLKNVERTRGRIQFLLKEGYAHRQNRDYAQAVDVWEKILAVEEGNSQARRLIVEAHMAAAGEAVSTEDFDKAVKHCEGVLRVEPKHPEAGNMLADAVAKRDRVAELRRTAEMARNKGDLGRSAKAWKELTGIVPKSKLARDGLNSTRKTLSHRRAKRLLVVLILLVIGGAAWFSYQDWALLRKAETALKEGKFPEARDAARHIWIPWFKERAQEIFKKAAVQAALSRAGIAERKDPPDWSEAIEAMKEILKHYGQVKAREKYEQDLNRYEYHYNVELAGAAEEKSDWQQAQTRYVAAASAARKHGDLKDQVQRAERDRLYCFHVGEGLRVKATDKEEAISQFRQALLRRRDGKRARAELRELGAPEF